MGAGDQGVPISRINHNGNYNLSKLLHTIQNWMTEEGYDFKEKTYKQKNTDEGLEIETEIEGERKHSAYLKFSINVLIKIKDQNNVEITRNGKKETTQNGRLMLETSGKVESDWQKAFTKSTFLKNANKILDKYILGPLISKHQDELYYTIISLQKTIKKAMDFEAV